MLIDLFTVASPLIMWAGVWWIRYPDQGPPNAGAVMLMLGVALGVLAFVFRSHSSLYI